MKMEWGDGQSVDTDLLSDEAREEYRQTCNSGHIHDLMKVKRLTLSEALEHSLCYAIRTALKYPDGHFDYLLEGYER